MKPVDDTKVWSVVCGYVANPYRGLGLQHQMLAAAGFARDNGARALEAYPVDKGGRSHDDFMFFGSRSLYERTGFREVVRRSPTRVVMRRRTTAPCAQGRVPSPAVTPGHRQPGPHPGSRCLRADTRERPVMPPGGMACRCATGRVCVSQQALQFLDAQAAVRKDPAQRSLGYIATVMYGYRSPSPIWMTHDVVTASDAGHLEPGFF